MTKNDLPRFAAAWIQTYAAITYKSMPPNHPSIQAAFTGFAFAPVEEVETYLQSVAHSNTTGFMEPVGKLLEQFRPRPERMTNEQLLDLAEVHTTPLGRFVYSTVSSQTMQALPRNIQLRHLAHHRETIDQFIANFQAGCLTSRERLTLALKNSTTCKHLLDTEISPHRPSQLATEQSDGIENTHIHPRVRQLVKKAMSNPVPEADENQGGEAADG